MINTSKNINLAQLTQELGGKGLIADFNNPENKIVGPADGVELTESELQVAIDRHIATKPVVTKETVLARLGITEEEAKLLLS